MPWADTHTVGWDSYPGLGRTPWAGTHTLGWDAHPELGHTPRAGTHTLGWDTCPGLGHTPWAGTHALGSAITLSIQTVMGSWAQAVQECCEGLLFTMEVGLHILCTCIF